jgi:hypothetical protein
MIRGNGNNHILKQRDLYDEPKTEHANRTEEKKG